MWWDCLSQNVQSHSLPVGYRKRCDETALHKMCNVTHFLLFMGRDVMRLPSTTIFNIAHILSVIEKRNIEPLLRNNCNVTHILLAIGKFLIRSSFEPLNQHDMLLTSYVHRKRCDLLLFTKLATSLTICKTKECVQIPVAVHHSLSFRMELASWVVKKENNTTDFLLP